MPPWAVDVPQYSLERSSPPERREGVRPKHLIVQIDWAHAEGTVMPWPRQVPRRRIRRKGPSAVLDGHSPADVRRPVYQGASCVLATHLRRAGQP